MSLTRKDNSNDFTSSIFWWEVEPSIVPGLDVLRLWNTSRMYRLVLFGSLIASIVLCCLSFRRSEAVAWTNSGGFERACLMSALDHGDVDQQSFERLVAMRFQSFKAYNVLATVRTEPHRSEVARWIRLDLSRSRGRAFTETLAMAWAVGLDDWRSTVMKRAYDSDVDVQRGIVWASDATFHPVARLRRNESEPSRRKNH